jgi:vancomycin resistance protein VanW
MGDNSNYKLRRFLRVGVPMELQQFYARTARAYRDRVKGIRFPNDSGGRDWPIRRELTQVVIRSQLYENKLSNLRRGAAAIDGSLIEPGSSWSFWRRVGKPSRSNGFLEGRNIVDGRLQRQVGGGLCQLSSLIYHLALLGGLEIIERHAHSVDIYRENERFTPLGADATVVWGFKDLRLRNPYQFPISVGCLFQDERLAGQIRSEKAIPLPEVSFVREELAPGRVRVLTMVSSHMHGVTEYDQRPGLGLE